MIEQIETGEHDRDGNSMQLQTQMKNSYQRHLSMESFQSLKTKSMVTSLGSDHTSIIMKRIIADTQ